MFALISKVSNNKNIKQHPPQTKDRKMGYSHYFTQVESTEGDDRNYLKFAIDAMIIILTAENRGANLNWHVDENSVKINGIGEGAHEDFYFTREANLNFNFCKTAFKPYDEVVTACLIALKKAYGDKVDIGSDGEWESDWVAGRALYQMAVQETAISPLKTYATA